MVLLVLLGASFNPLVFIHYCSGKRSNFTIAEYFYPLHLVLCKSTCIFLSFTPSSVQKHKHISVLHTQLCAKAQAYFCASHTVLCKSASIFMSFMSSSVQNLKHISVLHTQFCAKSTSIFLSFTPSSVQKLKHISVLHTQFCAKDCVWTLRLSD